MPDTSDVIRLSLWPASRNRSNRDALQALTSVQRQSTSLLCGDLADYGLVEAHPRRRPQGCGRIPWAYRQSRLWNGNQNEISGITDGHGSWTARSSRSQASG